MDQKNFKTGLITLLIIGLGLFLIGCAETTPNDGSPYTDPSPQNDHIKPYEPPEHDAIPGINPETPPKDDNPIPSVTFDTIEEANNQFAMDLYSKYKTEEGNLFFSPYSISSALAMTYEGAKGRTADEMQAVLHLPKDKEKIHSGYKTSNDELNNPYKSYELHVANALWAQEDYSYVDQFFTTVDTYYGGKVTNLDFKTETEKSRVTINDWVEEETNERIKDLIPPGVLDPQTILVLTNALYFKANWSSQFDAQDTRDGMFTLGSGATTEVEMMHQTSAFNYGETSDLQLLEMDYLDDDLSMLIVLPKGNNLPVIENMFSKETLSGWKKGMRQEEVRVTLPKFEMETLYFMKGTLVEMGMPAVFKPGIADFTGMSPTGEIYISEVIHKTFIEVAEYGTEAAAATAVVAKATGMPMEIEEPKIFTVDHPFIFMIQQKETGNILFMGRVADPGK